jgi:hypothetical protein
VAEVPVVARIFEGRAYRLAFFRKCCKLIGLGYARLKPESLCLAEETEITGELVRAIAAALESDDHPSWMRFFFVADDPPQNVGGRLGRRRLRVDLEFIESRVTPRNRFRCEAKRLYRSGSVSEYLGSEGLGMFLTGAYSSSEDESGLIGYVQTGSVSEWLDRIDAGLRIGERDLAICTGTRFGPVDVGSGLKGAWLSCHERTTVGRRIHIFHILLSFAATEVTP